MLLTLQVQELYLSYPVLHSYKGRAGLLLALVWCFTVRVPARDELSSKLVSITIRAQMY